MPDLIVFNKNHKNKRVSHLDHQAESSWRRFEVPHSKRCLQVKMVSLGNLEAAPSPMHQGFLIGEWEGPTAIVQVKENGENHFIHTPAASYPSKKEWNDNLQAEYPEKLHNTDPLFFGARFYYANCLQYAEGCNHLREIPDGSLILFGEHGDESRRLYRIECVFHVRRSLPYSPEKLVEETLGGVIDCDNARPYRGKIIENYFLASSTLPLYCFDDTLKKRTYQLYFGSAYQQGSTRPFSFFPCRNRPFKAQPVIDLAGFKLSQNRPHAAARHTFTEPELEIYFRDIAKTIVKQGFALGIRAGFL